MAQTTNISSAFSKYCTGYCGFAFNGQEKDQEVYNNQSTTTATFWEYDGRIGRRWNIDPVMKEWESGYACFGGNPVIMVDINGDNAYKWDVNVETGEKTKTGEDGGKDVQIAHFYKKNEKGDHIQVGSPKIIDGPEIYSGKTKDGAAVSNIDLWEGIPQNLSGYKGYSYTSSDLEMRYNIMNGNSHILKQAIINFEKTGWAEPLTSNNYWNLYGETLGSLLAMQFYVTAGAGLATVAQGGDANQSSLKQFNYVKRYNHSSARALLRGVTERDIKNTLEDPLSIKCEIKYDGIGRASQKIIGRTTTVIINPNTGKRITTYPTSSKLSNKLFNGN